MGGYETPAPTMKKKGRRWRAHVLTMCVVASASVISWGRDIDSYYPSRWLPCVRCSDVIRYEAFGLLAITAWNLRLAPDVEKS